MMLDHEGLFTAFRMPGQRAVREPAPPRLVHYVHHAARRPQPERADPKAEDHHRARHRSPRRRGYPQPGPELHLPSAHGVPGPGEDLAAMPDEHRTGEPVIP